MEKTVNDLLQRAIEIAVEGHKGQKDKAGQPYILHPLAVMLQLDDPIDRIVGVLHDVLEDCNGWTPERLQEEGFPTVVIEALVAVSKLDESESYEEFVLRCKAHPVARRVKIADLHSNLDRTRLATVTAKDEDRFARYARALEVLLQD